LRESWDKEKDRPHSRARVFPFRFLKGWGYVLSRHKTGRNTKEEREREQRGSKARSKASRHLIRGPDAQSERVKGESRLSETYSRPWIERKGGRSRESTQKKFLTGVEQESLLLADFPSPFPKEGRTKAICRKRGKRK